MITIKITWNDLNKKFQDKLLKVFGDNNNWDIVPMTVMEIEDEREIEIDSLFDTKQPEKEENANDPVNHPAHYTQGKIEVIEFITDKKLNFCRGNAVKYIARAGLKDPEKEVEDLKKAIFYLNYEIKRLENKE